MSVIGLPARIETERLVLRHLVRADADAWAMAIGASLESLKAFMPWAHDEPQPMSARLALIDLWRDGYENGTETQFGMFLDDVFVGGTGLSTRRGAGVLEIGYWVHVDHRRRGIATEACRGQIAAAFEVDGIERVEIWCDAANSASAAVAAKVGCTLVDQRAGKIITPGDCGIDQRWRLDRWGQVSPGSYLQ